MRPTATVIIPTFGDARFARWAIRSIQDQTVKNIEICIVCDGSPDGTRSTFESLAKQDRRIKVFAFPKSPRTGEPHRDVVIGQTRGRIVCYCAHDDLWLPFHVEQIERTLRGSSFTNSFHAAVNVPEEIRDEDSLFKVVYRIELSDPEVRCLMLSGENRFGLTFGAHTRKAYYELHERWVTTPCADMPTDLYMWNKFLVAHPQRCRTTPRITALGFPRPFRQGWSEQRRDDELRHYYEKIQDPGFVKRIEAASQ